MNISEQSTTPGGDEHLLNNAFQDIPNHGIVEGVDIKDSFVFIIRFLQEFPEELSGRGKKPDPSTPEGIRKLAQKYYKGYTRSHFPKISKLIPDDVVSMIMEEAYDISTIDRQANKEIHSKAMSAENCLGQLLEKYIDSVTRSSGWVWVAGDLIKAVDFIFPEHDSWKLLQIKNRSNSENSSSKAIRDGTEIEPWCRIKAENGMTYWDSVPESMRNLGLSEDNFRQFVVNYIRNEKERVATEA